MTSTLHDRNLRRTAGMHGARLILVLLSLLYANVVLAEEPATQDANPIMPTRDPNPRVKLHAIGLAFHATTFAAENHYGYTLMGPSASYTYFVGRRWGFAIRGEIYFPLSSRYAGPDTDFRAGLREPYSNRRIGLDGLVLAARRFPLMERVVLTTGVGVHVQSFKLSGTQYAPVEGITGGIGGMARIDWRLTRHLVLGGEFATAIDPIDFVRHANRAVITVPFSLGLSLGFVR